MVDIATNARMTPTKIRSAPLSDKLIVALRAIIFFAVFEKEIGPRLFLPQGEAYIPSQPIYYLEFFISIISIILLLMHIRNFSKEFFRQIDITSFFIFAFFRVALDRFAIESVIYACNYVEIFVVIGLVLRFDGEKTLKSYLVYFAIFSIVSNAASIIIPSTSIMHSSELSGYFRGLTPHRNDLSYAITVDLFIIINYYSKSISSIALSFLCIVMILAAGSVQGIILTIIGLFIYFVCLFRGISKYRKYAIVLGVLGLGLIYVFIPAIFPRLLEFFGRDTSFTGRDKIWKIAWNLIDREPVFGYGAQKFGKDELPNTLLLHYRLGTDFGSAHSSYLEAILTYGWYGAYVFFAIIVRQSVKLFRSTLSSNINWDSLPIILTLFCIIGGITASEKMFFPGPGWLSLVLARFLIDVELRNQLVFSMKKKLRSASAKYASGVK